MSVLYSLLFHCCLMTLVHFSMAEDAFSGQRKENICDGKYFSPKCRDSETIRIYSALWGRMEKVCKLLWKSRCKNDVTMKVSSECSGKQQCHLQANTGIFGNPCNLNRKEYLAVTYACVKEEPPTNPRTTHSLTDFSSGVTYHIANNTLSYSEQTGNDMRFTGNTELPTNYPRTTQSLTNHSSVIYHIARTTSTFHEQTEDNMTLTGNTGATDGSTTEIFIGTGVALAIIGLSALLLYICYGKHRRTSETLIVKAPSDVEWLRNVTGDGEENVYSMSELGNNRGNDPSENDVKDVNMTSREEARECDVITQMSGRHGEAKPLPNDNSDGHSCNSDSRINGLVTHSEVDEQDDTTPTAVGNGRPDADTLTYSYASLATCRTEKSQNLVGSENIYEDPLAEDATDDGVYSYATFNSSVRDREQDLVSSNKSSVPPVDKIKRIVTEGTSKVGKDNTVTAHDNMTAASGTTSQDGSNSVPDACIYDVPYDVTQNGIQREGVHDEKLCSHLDSHMNMNISSTNDSCIGNNNECVKEECSEEQRAPSFGENRSNEEGYDKEQIEMLNGRSDRQLTERDESNSECSVNQESPPSKTSNGVERNEMLEAGKDTLSDNGKLQEGNQKALQRPTGLRYDLYSNDLYTSN